jgi:hypothetical protein
MSTAKKIHRELLSPISILPKKISTKSVMSQLLQDGVFGNCLRLFASVDEAMKSNPSQLYLRVKRPAFTFHPVGFTTKELPAMIQKMELLGVNQDELIIGEANNPNEVLANMEILRTEQGLYVQWSPEKLRMRDALKRGMNHAYGLKAKAVVDYFLSPCSRTNLDRLLEEWPDHVVECTAHRGCLGSVPGNNTAFWEVRQY